MNNAKNPMKKCKIVSPMNQHFLIIFLLTEQSFPQRRERERAREIQEVVWSQKSLNNFTIWGTYSYRTNTILSQTYPPSLLSFHKNWRHYGPLHVKSNNSIRKNKSTRKHILYLKMYFLVDLFFLIELFFLIDFYMKRPLAWLRHWYKF